MQFGLFEEPRRKPVKVSVKREVFKRAKGKCESCGIKLSMSEGDFHHTRTPSISPTARSVQFLCPTCHRRYGHKRKTVTRDKGTIFEEREHVIKRKKAPTKGKTTKKTKPKKRRVPAERDIFGDVIRWKYVTAKPKKKTTKKKTKRKKRRTNDSWDFW